MLFSSWCVNDYVTWGVLQDEDAFIIQIAEEHAYGYARLGGLYAVRDCSGKRIWRI